MLDSRKEQDKIKQKEYKQQQQNPKTKLDLWEWFCH